MRKKISIVMLVIVLAMLVSIVAVACTGDPDPDPKPQAGKGLDVAFLKDLKFDLDGVTGLAIEKRATAAQAEVKNASKLAVAYADEIVEKNKLVGETEDREVIEIMLRTKLGEVFSQDDLQAQFNKLCVSGNFIYFELIPADIAENTGDDGMYYYYTEDDYDESGELKEDAEPKSSFISLRTNYSGEALTEFEKTSVPSDVVGAFVYSMENEKIYDLSNNGYEVLGVGVVRVGGELYRVSINEDDVMDADEVFSSYQKDKVRDIRIDKYGNVFAKSNTSFVDKEKRVYVEDAESNKVWYFMNDEGQAVQLNESGIAKWIDGNGLRELQVDDNFVQRKTYMDNFYWEGISDGESIYYRSTMDFDVWDIDAYNEIVNDLGYSKNLRLSSRAFVIVSDEAAVWLDVENPEIGANVFEDFASEYPNAKLDDPWGKNPNSFVVQRHDGETTYEFYWDDEEETVDIRVQEEITSTPVETKKFQPIN